MNLRPHGPKPCALAAALHPAVWEYTTGIEKKSKLPPDFVLEQDWHLKRVPFDALNHPPNSGKARRGLTNTLRLQAAY